MKERPIDMAWAIDRDVFRASDWGSQQPAKPPAPHGASLSSSAAYWRLVFAICLGTIIEWMDFTAFAQLNLVLTAIFFPPSSPSVAQIAFWGIYASGFAARPLGALAFGHIGDTVGRRAVLLLTILTMTIPTVLIGCLPTYASIGVAAPVLLAVLRFIQGFATGGEFGGAVVYLHEIAPQHCKGLTSSLGQMAVGPGILIGICVVQIVFAACSEDMLLVWGWRIPFLLAVVNAAAGVLLRMHMPEPQEFLDSKQQMRQERVARVASNRLQQRIAHCRPGGASRTCQQQQQPQAKQEQQQGQTNLRIRSGNRSPEAAAASPASCNAASSNGISTVSSGSLSSSQTYCYDAETGEGSNNLPAVAATPSRFDEFGRLRVLFTPFSAPSLQWQQQPSFWSGSSSYAEELQQEVARVEGRIHHHVPLEVLLREHWVAMLLQTVFYSWAGAAFFVYYSWLPSWIHTLRGFPSSTTLWMALTGVVAFTLAVPLVGHLGDRGMRRVTVCLAAIAISGIADVPAFLAFSRAPLAVCWLLQLLMLALVGLHAGLMTTIGPLLYPPAVRVSGYNFAHNLSASVMGGLAPLIITSLEAATGSQVLAPGLTLAVISACSFAGGLALLYYVPDANSRGGCPARPASRGAAAAAPGGAKLLDL